ncbi:hypothetical protein RQP53_08065 [Paucibacter sp. APW11]|uniref:PepSY domain-containing protein n=1 Tax=Roseateles aquae TaxID=3077235 RepID=A0ABU3P9G4_9BURK|nr:hypothetical protein [Paucibacter sp. APW11]MDT8999220.1 hypothetical protein [Paucibacter sp. APW11]
MKKTLTLAAALAAAAMLCSPAHAAGSGMRVTKDAETGKLRAATAEESARLDALAGKAIKEPRGLLTGKVAPKAIKHADGSVEQELDESSLSFSVVTRNTDGSLDTHCVTGAEAADALVSGKQKPAKAAKAAKEHRHDDK